MGEVERLKEKLENCEYSIAELTDKNQFLESQVEAFESQVEDLLLQLEDTENGTNTVGFIDPVRDDAEDEIAEIDDLSLEELCKRQQAELNKLLKDCREAVDKRDSIIAMLEETAKSRDSILESRQGTIKALKKTISQYREMLDSKQKIISEIFPIMQSRIDKRDILLMVHRDKMTKAEAVSAFAKINNNTPKEVEDLFNNSKL